MSSLRRPDRFPIISRIIGKTCQIRPVHTHHINIRVSVTLRGKGDLAPIGRPRRFSVPSRVVSEVGLVGAVGVHHVDFILAITVRYKGNLASHFHDSKVDSEL